MRSPAPGQPSTNVSVVWQQPTQAPRERPEQARHSAVTLSLGAFLGSSLGAFSAGKREQEKRGTGGFSEQVSHYSSWDRVTSPFFSANLQLALLRDWLLPTFPSSDAQRPLVPQGCKPARFRFLSEGGKVGGGGETQRTFKDTSGRSPPFFRLACKASGCISPAPLVNEQLVETVGSHAEIALCPTSEDDTSDTITVSSTYHRPYGLLCCLFSYH